MALSPAAHSLPASRRFLHGGVAPRRRAWRYGLRAGSSLLCMGLALPAPAFAQTQIEEDRARLGNSTPLVQQIDPA
ncbi:MAG: hypothetical protein ABF826_11805, partial [Komagataeibacter saccharivorans]